MSWITTEHGVRMVWVRGQGYADGRASAMFLGAFSPLSAELRTGFRVARNGGNGGNPTCAVAKPLKLQGIA